jgi:hypothetical protein
MSSYYIYNNDSDAIIITYNSKILTIINSPIGNLTSEIGAQEGETGKILCLAMHYFFAK